MAALLICTAFGGCTKNDSSDEKGTPDENTTPIISENDENEQESEITEPAKEDAASDDSYENFFNATEIITDPEKNEADKEYLVGLWRSNYVYEGNDFVAFIEYYEDGTYLEILFKNGAFRSTEAGNYTFEKHLVENELFDGSAYTRYVLENGQLENGGRFFDKIK